MSSRKIKVTVAFLAVALIVAVAVSVVLVLNKTEEKLETEKNTVVDTNVVSFNGSEYVLNEDISTFLVIGLDAATEVGKENTEQKQADFILLFVIDSKAKKVSALHINRDTVTDVNLLALDGSRINTVKEPIALAYSEGDGRMISCRNTADAVSNFLLGVKIDNYASFTMDTVSAINDSAGGVSVTVEDDMTSIDPSFEKGKTVTLFGEKALQFVRARGGLEDSSNIKRMTRQRQYLINLFSTIRDKLKTDDNFVIDLFPKISDGIITNCSLNRMDSILDKSSGYAFTGFTDIEGESAIGEKFMEFHPDRAALEKTVVELFYKKKQD